MIFDFLLSGSWKHLREGDFWIPLKGGASCGENQPCDEKVGTCSPTPWFPGKGDSIFQYVHIILEKEMATHSNILAWRIPWMEEPGRLQSTGSQRVGHDWATSLSFTFFVRPYGLWPSRSSVHLILQAGILEWVPRPFSRESSAYGLNLHLICLLHGQVNSSPLAPPEMEMDFYIQEMQKLEAVLKFT